MFVLLFEIEVDVITEYAREDLINEILFADNLVLCNKSMEKRKFLKWKEAFESKGLRINLKTKVMVSSSKG